MSAELLVAAPYVAGALGAGGVAVVVSRRRELIAKWATWCVSATLVGGALLLGDVGAIALAAVLGVVAAYELSTLLSLERVERLALTVAAVVLPTVALVAPERMFAGLLLASLVVALPGLVRGDANSTPRTHASTWAVLWLAGLSGLVLLDPSVVLAIVLAVSVGDVAAWGTGRLVGGPLLSPLSPANGWSGVVGGAAVGVLVLAALGSLNLATVVAVTAAAPIGDLLESQLKRHAGVKDAGRWLPGFGGLLDRIDSLVPALAVAVALS